MKALELALKYMECVFQTNEFENLRDILAEDLKFKGPFFSFNSANDYINSLQKDPPLGFNYKIIKTYEDNSSACLIYKFSKPGVTTTMMQVFKTDEERIKDILLVFDTAVFN